MVRLFLSAIVHHHHTPLGIQPMILASAKHLDVPVFDGDLMGRAYPCV